MMQIHLDLKNKTQLTEAFKLEREQVRKLQEIEIKRYPDICICSFCKRVINSSKPDTYDFQRESTKNYLVCKICKDKLHKIDNPDEDFWKEFQAMQNETTKKIGRPKGSKNKSKRKSK